MDQRGDGVLVVQHAQGKPPARDEIGMHPLRTPMEPHFVHLSWAIRRLSSAQLKYIRIFYGDQALAAIRS